MATPRKSIYFEKKLKLLLGSFLKNVFNLNNKQKQSRYVKKT